MAPSKRFKPVSIIIQKKRKDILQDYGKMVLKFTLINGTDMVQPEGEVLTGNGLSQILKWMSCRRIIKCQVAASKPPISLANASPPKPNRDLCSYVKS